MGLNFGAGRCVSAPAPEAGQGRARLDPPPSRGGTEVVTGSAQFQSLRASPLATLPPKEPWLDGCQPARLAQTLMPRQTRHCKPFPSAPSSCVHFTKQRTDWWKPETGETPGLGEEKQENQRGRRRRRAALCWARPAAGSGPVGPIVSPPPLDRIIGLFGTRPPEHPPRPQAVVPTGCSLGEEGQMDLMRQCGPRPRPLCLAFPTQIKLILHQETLWLFSADPELRETEKEKG